MKRGPLAAIVMVLGMLILFVGPLVVGALPSSTYWSDADQEVFEKASVEAHAATYGGVHDDSQPHAHGLPTDSEGKAKLEATLAEFERHNSRLKAAQSSQYWLGIGCRALGLLVAAGGIFLYVQARRAEPQ